MLYLATASGPMVREAIRSGELAQMLTYKSANRLVEGATFAVDNGRVILVDGQPVTDPNWSARRWLRHLRRQRGLPGCLFAAVPDYVGDAAATDALWARWAPVVRQFGFPVAYVLQDGCRRIPRDADVVFIGGSTEWKLGPVVRALVAHAKARGMWVHCGRVNGGRRWDHMLSIGCDSVDGTFLAFAPDKNLPRLRKWMAR